MILYCATTNPGKLFEFRHAAGDLAQGVLDIEPLPGLKQLEPPEETGETFKANAILKAAYYSRFTDGYLFAEDSGLMVDALGGAPGVHSARFSGGGDEANNQLLLERLRGAAQRAARYQCVIALVRQGTLLGTFSGEVEGRIIDDRRGGNGFGYDPYFFCPAFGCTFGEATAAMKLAVSHRGEAVRAMLQAIRNGLIQSA